MVFTYNINDDDAVPFAFFKNVDGTTATEAGSIDEENLKVTIALSHRKIFIYIILMPELVPTSDTDATAITASQH